MGLTNQQMYRVRFATYPYPRSKMKDEVIYADSPTNAAERFAYLHDLEHSQLVYVVGHGTYCVDSEGKSRRP